MNALKRTATALLIVLLPLGLLVDSAKAQGQVPQEVLVNYSLAAEYFKNEDYESALPYLRWLTTNHPTAYQPRRVWERLADSYANIGKAQEDAALKTAYYDSTIATFETGLSTLKDGDPDFDEARWRREFGNFIVQNRADFSDEADVSALEQYRTMFDLDPENFDPYYARLVVDEYRRAEDKAGAVEFMDTAQPYYPADSEIVAYFDETRNNLFRDPEERLAFLEDQLTKKPGDIEIMTELFELYRAFDNADKMSEIGNMLLEQEPNARTLRLLAQLRYDNGNYDEAVTLNEQALELADTDELKRDIHYNIALAQYAQDRLAPARNAARRALRLDSGFGDAQELIGDIYVKAVRGTEREDRAVYWLAIDYYNRAAANGASGAGRKASLYRQYMPSAEDKFFKGWTAGQSYAINYGAYSWIGETTTVK